VPEGPRYPEEASTMASPFFDAMLLGALVDERFSDGFMFGAQVGGYFGNRFRLAGRFVIPSDASDEASAFRIGYAYHSELPSFMYGATAGVVVSQRATFVFSPGFALHRTDLADYGTIIGANFPFEWVLRGGVRFGLEAAVGRALGGRIRYQCIEPTQCGADETEEDRDSGVAFMLSFSVGFGLGYPDPLPRKSAPVQ
jgi:hypothetical protein